MHRVRRATTTESSATTTAAAAIDSEMLQLERHVRMLEDAYQDERRQRELLEKKYARLKRRYIRLERAHAKIVLETHEMHRSDARDRSALPPSLNTSTDFDPLRPASSSGNVRLALPSRDAYSSPVYATERSPMRLDQRSTPDTDVIDLTSPTSRSTQARARSPGVALVDTLRTTRTTARALSDDFCAESPDSSRGDDDESSRRYVETASAAGRRQLDYGLADQRRPAAPAQLQATHATDDRDSSVRLRSTNARDASSLGIGRPRPRLGLVDSPDRRIRRGPEQDRDYDLSRRRRRQAVEAPAARHTTTSPASSVASSPTTINSSPRSSPGRNNNDDDEAASLALAQYLQQQENIAAFEEYEARARAAAAERERVAMMSNQHEFDGHQHHHHAASALPLQSRDIDPDNMTYDELLQLGEENGDVKRERWRQMAVQVISCLPTHRWTGDNTADASCIICQYSFVRNDRALTLPCAHVFHEECVDSWIRENNSCPLCKLEIVNV